MKYFLLCICALVGFITCNAQSDSNKIQKRVFLFAGQSNMDGRADGGQLDQSDLKRLERVADRIQFYYNHQPVSDLQLTRPKEFIQNKFDLETCFGPELFFGIQLAERFPDEEFIFIKRSAGGTSLHGCWNPYWNEANAMMMDEQDKPRLYEDFISYTRTILSELSPEQYEITGMLWVQGEADSGVSNGSTEAADRYYDNLRNLVERTRKDLEAENLPFVIFQVGSGKVVKGMKRLSKQDKHAYMIPQSRNKKSPDYYERNPPPIGHYTSSSMKKIGVAFFEVFEGILE